MDDYIRELDLALTFRLPLICANPDKVVIRKSNNVYNQSLVASLIANNGKGKTAEWAKGLVNNMARKPKGNDRAQILAVAAGEAELAVANTYYIALMLSGKKGPEQQAAAKKVKPFFPNQLRCKMKSRIHSHSHGFRNNHNSGQG